MRAAYDWAAEAPRTNHSAEVYAQAFGFGEVIPRGALVLDVGSGDADDAVQRMERDYGVDIVRLDSQYATQHPRYREGAVAGLAQELPFKSEVFDTVVAAFTLQHVPKADVGRVVSEMLRVAKVSEGFDDHSKGIIEIFPVFKPKELEKLITKAGAEKVARVGFHSVPRDEFLSRSMRRTENLPTLMLCKTAPGLEVLDALAEGLSGTDVFKPKAVGARIGALARRACIRVTGNTRRDTP